MLFQLTTSINITNCSMFLRLRNASNICYTRANFAVDDPQQAPTPLHAWRTNPEQFDQGSLAPTVVAANAVAQPQPRIPHPMGTVGPNDYFQYQSRQYPHLVSNGYSPLTCFFSVLQHFLFLQSVLYFPRLPTASPYYSGK
jgi:hypothetical protein